MRMIHQQIFKKSLNIEFDSTLVLSVGELNYNKNHSTVIKAIAELREKNVHYIIAGVGDKKDELEMLAKRLDIADRVHLLGFRCDIPEILQAVDIYCLPSIREGLNVSLMEAMASGLPCVVSNIRGNVDLIEDDKWGYRVTSTDADAWENRIEKMMSEYKKQMNGYVLEKIREFSLDNVKRKMEKIYKE